MSTEIWTDSNTQIKYQIGTIGWESFQKLSQLPDSIIPTYGIWAGPGWAPGVEDEDGHQIRSKENSQINWAINPCMNDSVIGSSNPDQCLSILDAICKSHDWNYYQAEETGDNMEAKEMIILADTQLLKDIAAAVILGRYESPTGIYNEGDGTWAEKMYTGIFDGTEALYTTLLVPAFAIKLGLWDTPTTILSEAMGAFNTIWNSIGTTETIYVDPNDSSKMIRVQEQSNGSIIYEKKEDMADIGWILDQGTQKAFNAATVKYGAGSTKAENTFAYSGNGHIIINGGSGNDKITTGENEINATYFEIAGGDGYDTYYLTDGDNFKIVDSGANRIYKEDEDGGYFSVGNLYKITTDDIWVSADGSSKISHNSPWTITFEDGSSVGLDSSFKSGDYGINLIEVPDNPTATNTILGDLTPVDFDPNEEGIQTKNDQWGNAITDPKSPDLGRVDGLYDTTGNDRIVAGDGNDGIVSCRGGNDWLSGGNGDDFVMVDHYQTNSGNDVLEGNVGSDIVEGGKGNDKVFGGDYGEMEQLIAIGETADGINARGDVVSGGEGEDYIYGSSSIDALFGGLGKDLIVGGGGNDVITGDDNYFGAVRDWSFTITTTASGNTNIYGLTYSGISGGLDDTGKIGDDDVIYGGAGNDYIDGVGGDDEIYGGAGDDILFGSAGNDFIEGGDGDDAIKGDGYSVSIELQGADYIDGGAGNDLIWGNSGNDELFGGDGQDTIYGDEGDDYIDGEAGANSLYGGAGNDIVFGGDDNDLIEGDSSEEIGDDYLDGGSGNDIIIGAGGADEIFGGAGDDQLHGDASNVALPDQGDDYIDGEGGDNLLVGYGGDDTLYAAEGNDTIYGDAGDDYIDAGDGTNKIYAGEGNDEIYAGQGNDQIDAGLGEDYIDAGDGSNIIVGGEGNNEIHAGAGDDQISGGTGNDYIDAGEGNNVIASGAGDDFISSGAGNDQIWGGTGRDEIYSGAGDDQLYDEGGDSRIYGGEGNDWIQATDGNAFLDGGTGDDTLLGGTGSDTIYGGTGNDFLQGNKGNDTYIFGRGDGDTVINNYAEDYATTTDTVKFSEAISSTDLDWVIEGSNLRINISGGSDSLLIQNWFAWIGANQCEVDQFQFSDGETLKAVQLNASGFNAYGTSGRDTLYGWTGGDRLYGYEGNDYLIAGSGDDKLDGGSGNDTLCGDAGADIMIGLTGNDKYEVDNTGDIVIENADEGTDTVASAITYTLGMNMENLNLTGSDGIDGTGNEVRNIIVGNNAANRLYGVAGDDEIWGYGGNDTIDGGIGNDALVGSCVRWSSWCDWRDLTADSNGDDAYLFGRGSGQDEIFDRDAMVGNMDTILLDGVIRPEDVFLSREMSVYMWNTADNLVLSVKGSGDKMTVANWFEGTREWQVERIQFSDGTVWDEQKIKQMVLQPTEGEDYLIGYDTDDIISGLAGNDYIEGDAGNDVIYGKNGNDNIYGGEGNDTLNGGVGADSMIGGTGNDRYYVDNTGDVVTENADKGTDAVYSSLNYTLGANLENLILTGTEAINAAGNELNNSIKGNASDNILSGGDGDDTLNGGLGADCLSGGLGNDRYYVDNINDLVTENVDEGMDVVYSSIDYTLGNNLENLVLTGTEGINGVGNELNNSLTGNAAANIMTGGAGNDTLNGGVGADMMIGGTGNDRYYVDNTGDVVTENVDEGTDAVYSSLNYTLGANLENLILTGAEAINAAGNELNNSIKGNASDNMLSGGDGDDTLNGGLGADCLSGGLGNDRYYVDNTGDVVTENVDEGTDAVYSSLNYTLGANLENLILTGTEAINAAGNELNNSIKGNASDNILSGGDGDDTLNGGLGADCLSGGLGNDRYYVDNTGDVVTENVDEGTDAVYSSLNYTLGANLENLILTGAEAINAAGNIWDNCLYGNTAANILSSDAGKDYLSGGDGDDRLIGGSGNDTLIGGNGSDTYLFGRTDGRDILKETAGVIEDTDTLRLTGDITTTEPILVQQNNDLYVFIDSDNYMRIVNEFQQTNYGIERLEVTDGHYITRTDIQTIVDTMSAINSDSGLSVMQKYNAMMADQHYQNILAQSWQQ